MNIQEAVDLLQEMGFKAWLMGEGLVGGVIPVRIEDRSHRTSLDDAFGIYQEGKIWIANFSGVGQFATIIKKSWQLDVAVEAACNFFKLKAQCTHDSISILVTIWSLQKNGLKAELINDTDIEIHCTNTFEVVDPYEFMLLVDDVHPKNQSCDFILRWEQEGKRWIVIDMGSAQKQQDYYPTNLQAAVEHIKAIRPKG